MTGLRAGLLGALAWLVCGAAIAADVPDGFDDPTLDSRYRALIREVRCPKCLNESIADSAAPVAADLRREIHAQIARGASDREIKDFLRLRYGDFVLYRPDVTPTTWALYAGPFVLLGVGGVVFWRILRARAAQSIDSDEDPLT